MPRLLLPQIKDHLHTLADQCALALSSGDEPFFKHLEWWLADGVFNLEPHGMFRAEQPYRAHDPRTVGEYLQQPTFHRWEGVHVLFDLFAQEVLEQLEQWAKEHLKDVVPADSLPTEDEWRHVFAPEWDEVLYMVGMHPRGPHNMWEEFLQLPVAAVIENWRPHAERAALERRGNAARMASQHEVEVAMIQRISKAVAARLSARTSAGQPPTEPAWEALLEVIAAEQGPVGALEVALYVHSSLFVNTVPSRVVAALHARYPLAGARARGLWHQPAPLG